MQSKVEIQKIDISAEVVNAVNSKIDFSEKISLVLMSAFLLLTQRYTSQEKIKIRFGNFLLEVNLSEDPSVIDIINLLNEKLENALMDKGTMCEDGECFPVSFSFNGEWNSDELLNTNSNFAPKITLNLKQSDQKISGQIACRRELFESLIIENIENHYINILEDIIDHPEKKVSEVSLLSDNELKKILQQWNATDAYYPENLCLHHLIERQVEKSPDSIAIIYKDQKYTYKELNNRANRIADYLIRKGVQPEDFVGVYMELSFEAVIALLGILKAGAAYVALDPNYPLKQIEFMVEDAKPKVLITKSKLKKNIQFDSNYILLMDEENWFNDLIPFGNPFTLVVSANLAYVMYTSGSSGFPKGVLIQHNSVVNNMMLIVKRYELTYRDTVLSMGSLAFDASVSKLFPILTIGGAIVLPTQEDVKDIEKMLHLIFTYKIPYFTSPPSILRVLNSMQLDLSGLRTISAGGESLKYGDIDHINKYIPILNIYGPTEATVSSCSYTLPKGSGPVSTIPIGKPNPNCKIYILDKFMNSVPIGCKGTLYIGGIGVARGYLNNAELTKKKFVKNPFDDNSIIYNSGDMARWLPDGNIEFLGRQDDQIKIRGYRIDIEAIEKTLDKFPSLEKNKIIITSNDDKDKAMVACLVAKKNHSVSIEEINEFLQQYFPLALIPSDYFIIDNLPLNQNQKVDIKALHQLYAEKQKNKNTEQTFKNNVEKEIAEFWRQLLKTEITLQDSFFHLGGHSLHAMQLKMFVNKKFHIDISMKDIFNNLTVRALSDFIVTRMNPDQFKNDSVLEIPHGAEVNNNRDYINDNSPINHGIASNEKVEKQKANGISRLTEQIVKFGNTVNAYNVFLTKPSQLPLSFNEERLWFLYNFLPHKSIYNIVKAYELKGNLDEKALELSLQQLFLRHINLRKNFMNEEGEPVAKINNKLKLTMHVHDYTKDINSESLNKLIEHEIETSFDLRTELPFRVNLVRKNKEDFILIIAAHHIIADAWSFNVLADELDVLYNSHLHGSKKSLPPLTEEYLNYAIVNKKFPKTEQFKESFQYWKERLSGRVDRMRLPYDKSAGNSYKGAYEQVKLSPDLLISLSNLAKDKNVTLFTVFFAAFQSLLYRYSQSENILTGVPIAGRNKDTEKLVGFFVNTLLLSLSFSDDSNFEELLLDAKTEVLNAYQHQDFPYETLAAELRKETGMDANSLIQVMFAFQNIPDEPLRLGGLDVKNVLLENKFAKFDLTVSVYDTEDGYIVSAEYKEGLFNRITIQRMLSYYVKLLQTVAENPTVKISLIDLLDEDEKNRILYEWNNTKTSIPDTNVHSLFENQSELTPDSIAIHFNDGIHASYNEINRRANQLAHYLLKQGMKAGELVGIFMDESDEAIVSMLAVLKAGGAYLPLDPTYPKERILYMLNDSNVNLIITNRDHLSSMGNEIYHYILSDKICEEISQESKHNPGLDISPDSLAYVIYTSGSTGNPKGVLIHHRAIVRLVKNTNYLQMDENLRLLKTGAFSFDASTFEVWGTLLNGGQLFMYPKENLLDPIFLKEKISEKNINTLWITSSWFNQLVDTDVTMFKPLKSLLTGGDRLSPKHVNKVKRALPELELINGYGPTENTTFSLFYKIESIHEDNIPVGKPISNSTVYILGNSLNLLPVGIQGEIYVGGDGVAKGYINAEKVTKEKFMTDPFHPGSTLYKTGDVGRWMEDGNIDFGGRKDGQVKLRGYRIELGEIENALANYSLIEEAVVLLKKLNNGEQQLIAFYQSPTDISVKEINSFLRKTLPSFMIPVQYNRIDSFPLTSNGKTNKAALLQLSDSNIQSADKFIAPDNAVEKKLLEIWTSVLGIDVVSTDGNFFHLGGNSLLATKLMSKVENEFNKHYSLSLLFEAPTVKELAAIISKENNLLDWKEATVSGLVPIQPKGSKPPIFLVPGYLFYHNLTKHMGDDQPIYGFEPLGDGTTEQMAAAYIKQIKLIQAEGPYYIGGYCASGFIAYEVAQQLLAKGEKVAMLTLFESYTPEGTVAKTSVKYLREKLGFWKNNFKTNDLNGKLQLIANESKKLLNYFFKDKLDSLNKFNSMIARYNIKPYSGDMMLFRASDFMIGSANDPYMGWNKYCPENRLKIVEVPGDHNTIFKEPNVAIIAAHLKGYISKDEYNVCEI